MNLLDGLFGKEIFQPHDGLNSEARHRLTYRRLQAIQAVLRLDRGLAADPARLHPLLERAAVCDPALFHVLAVHVCGGVGVTARYGGDESVLTDLEEGRSVASILITETGHSNSHIAQRAQARFDPGSREFVLHTPDDGAEKVPSNTGLAGMAKTGTVTARLLIAGRDRGVFCFAVPLSDEFGPRPGVKVTPLPDVRWLPCDFAAVRFDHVRLPFSGWLPDGAVIDPDGDFRDPMGGPEARLVRTMRFVGDMQTAAAVAVTATARAAVAGAIRYSCERVTAGRLRPGTPLIRFRSQQRALFEALATTYAMVCRTERIRDDPAAEAGPDSGPVGWSPWAAAARPRALAKAWVTEAAEQVLRDCRLHTGARGFMTERYLDYQALAQAYSAAGGSNELIALDAAMSMAEGTGYRPPDSGLHGPAGRAVLDPELWRHLARRREHALHAGLAGTPPGTDPFDHWNDRQPQALELARAHQDRVALECALAAARRTPIALRPAVDDLCALFALGQIARNAAWHLCAGLLTVEQASALDDARTRLCHRLEPSARTLADALAAGALG